MAGTPMCRTLGLVLVAVASVGCRDPILASPAATPVAPPDSVPYEIVDLGTLGGLYADGRAINDRGQVMGMSYVADGAPRAFLWDGGVMHGYGPLDERFPAIPYAFNAVGELAGLSWVTSQYYHAVRWRDSTAQDLGTLGGPRSYANALNSRGQVVGSSGVGGTADSLHAFLWDSGGMSDLGTRGGSGSEAFDINEAGQVVGWSNVTSGAVHAFLWQAGAGAGAGTMQDLGTLGGAASSAFRINERGQVAGTSETAAGETHAFLWSAGVMQDMGTLGFSGSEAVALNQRGQVAGNLTRPYESHAFLWDSGVTTMLDDGLSSHETVVHDMNDQGQVVGRMKVERQNGEDRFHAFLWEDGRLYDLGALGSESQYANSSATAINARGDIVGTSGIHPVLWRRVTTPPTRQLAVTSR